VLCAVRRLPSLIARVVTAHFRARPWLLYSGGGVPVAPLPPHAPQRTPSTSSGDDRSGDSFGGSDDEGGEGGSSGDD